MRIASWNVNSLRVRLPQLLDWLRRDPVDIVGLQELKLLDDGFPHAELREIGYEAVTNGQKTYNGVALLARRPILEVARNITDFVDEQRRVIAATIDGVRVINVYVPNGQTVDSPKYEYKLRWLLALKAQLLAELHAHPRLVVMGDFNVAPAPEDVHDPARWEGKVLFSAPERQAFQDLLALGLKDSYRLFAHEDPGFTWWDYRTFALRRNLGLRIDHVLLSSALAAACQSCTVLREMREQERPSDHAPVVVALGEPVPGNGD